MDQIRKHFPFRKSAKDEKFSCFLKNESLLVEELVVSFRGRCKLPIPCFTAEELIEATKNFAEIVPPAGEDHFKERDSFKGTLKERPVLVTRIPSSDEDNHWLRKEVIHNIVITSQMSHIKNVLKLFGCCLEFKYPVMVYEYAGTKLLSDVLHSPKDRESFSWKNRLRIAKDIANVILHLHTDFRTPIIYKVLTPSQVVIDQIGVTKLIDFTYSIAFPPGESKVDDPRIVFTFQYTDPEYFDSGYATLKTDVYCLGMLMLDLFRGKLATMLFPEEVRLLNGDILSCLEKDQLNQIVDAYILKEESSNAQRQEMQAFAYLALRCTQPEGKDRPAMIDVAKELSLIEKNCSYL